MDTVEEIAAAISKLPPEEYRRVLDWLKRSLGRANGLGLEVARFESRDATIHQRCWSICSAASRCGFTLFFSRIDPCCY